MISFDFLKDKPFIKTQLLNRYALEVASFLDVDPSLVTFAESPPDSAGRSYAAEIAVTVPFAGANPGIIADSAFGIAVTPSSLVCMYGL